jgi:hypothetical protein
MALHQSDGEIIRTIDDWVRNFCPPNVVKNAKNVQLIGDHCLAKHGFVSISGLTEAAHELGAGNLELVPEPKKLTADEQAAIFQKKEFARIQRETLENSVPFSERVKLNRTMIGWANYFCLGPVSKAYRAVDQHARTQ